MNELLTMAHVRALIPPMDLVRNKYTAGQLLCVGGFPGMQGAISLAATAAYRAGLGIVKWAVPSITSSVLPIEMVQLLATPASWPLISAELSRTRALLVGSGMPATAPDPWFALIMEGAREHRIPTVFDGGALHGIRAGWCAPSAGDLLTPHEGELLVLAGCSGPRLDLAWELARRDEVVVIAKGSPTYVVAVGHPVMVWEGGDPGMATAGTGDVLAGLCAGFLAQGLSSWEAAQLAVVLHGTAGQEAAQRMTSYGLIASDLLQTLPHAWKQLLGGST